MTLLRRLSQVAFAICLVAGTATAAQTQLRPLELEALHATRYPLAILQRNDFVFRYRVELNGKPYQVVVLLPRYFANAFGVWDDAWRVQSLYVPSASDPIFSSFYRNELQNFLWDRYDADGIFPPGFRQSPEFDSFAEAEAIDDERSALAVLTGPDSIWDVRAMLRAVSPMQTLRTDRRSLMRQFLPFELRNSVSPDFMAQWLKRKRRARFMIGHGNEGISAFQSGRLRSVVTKQQSVAWLLGGRLELKNFVHRPETVEVFEGGVPKRVRQDFLPLLLRIAEIHKMFSWTGLHVGYAVEDERSTERDVSRLLSITSRVLGRQAVRSEIGVRASELWLECVGTVARDRYANDFGFEVVFEFADPHLIGKTTYIMRVGRHVFFEKLQRYIASRPGFKLIPQAVLHHQNALESMDSTCARSLMNDWALAGLESVVVTRVPESSQRWSRRADDFNELVSDFDGRPVRGVRFEMNRVSAAF